MYTRVRWLGKLSLVPRLSPCCLRAVVAVLLIGCDGSKSADKPAAPRVPTPPGSSTRDTQLRPRASGGRIYVPTYSHIYTDEGVAEDLATTLSIRNVSTNRQLVLDDVRYYDTSGALIEQFLDTPAVLKPLETVEFFVRSRDRRGGSGANFIIGWHAEEPTVRPLTEAVMVRTVGTRGYAFSTRGIEIRSDSDLPKTSAADPAKTPEPDPAKAPVADPVKAPSPPVDTDE